MDSRSKKKQESECTFPASEKKVKVDCDPCFWVGPRPYSVLGFAAPWPLSPC